MSVKKQVCIYLFRGDWQEFLKLCKQEGVSGSQKIQKFIRTYNEAHRPGNPQLLMSYYAKPEEQQPLKVLCLYCQGALSNGQVFCQKKGMWIPGVKCYSCKHNRLRK